METHYKRHPKFNHLSVRSDGKMIKYYGDVITPTEHEPKPNKKMLVIMLNGAYYSLPKLVAETYLQPPESDRRHYALCIDGNYKNTHPNNLRWSISNISADPIEKFKIQSKRSKLTEVQSYECYKAYNEGVSLKKLAEKYNVSDMSVHRAVKRVKIKFEA